MAFATHYKTRLNTCLNVVCLPPRRGHMRQGARAIELRMQSRTTYENRTKTVRRASNDNTLSVNRVLSAAVPALAYATILFYTASYPDQTPLRDIYFIEKALGLGADDGVVLNPVFFSLFSLLGIYPVIYGSLMIPSARGSVVPVWPFVSLSVAFGVFGLFPYLIFWDLEDATSESPLDASELTSGFGKYAMQALESRLLPASTLVAVVGLLGYALTSGAESWNAYFKLFDESKFVHIASLDFCALSGLVPLFLWLDSKKRGVEWALPLVAVPMIGPLIYLILRPTASKS